MSRLATPALIGSLICFGIFFTNVSYGAAKKGVFLGDVFEMLMLFAASVLFVIGVLGKEARADETAAATDTAYAAEKAANSKTL